MGKYQKRPKISLLALVAIPCGGIIHKKTLAKVEEVLSPPKN